MKIAFSFFFLLFFFAVVPAQTATVNIIPKPNEMRREPGYFQIDRKTVIVVENPEVRPLAVSINDSIKRELGFRLRIKSRGDRNAILLSKPIVDYTVPEGGYELSVERDRIRVFASESAGRFYAVQSLFQLFEAVDKGVIKVPFVSIADEPRFGYRGMHLDVGRHFMPVEFIKKYIDLMAQYKFNYFHWHLTEDQGWRIEIKKYPKLTEIGSKRPETVLERNLQPYIGDKTPHEGFYTQEQIKDVVAYAKARYITVVPEIELPGHSSAALAAYPEFGCKQDYQYKVQTTWGIFKEVYCPTEKTFQFLEDVISEVADLFPDSPYIHIGGDEVLKDMWKESPEVKELMARENLKDTNEVQSYFIRRMEKFINSKGKKVIGWDEILEGGLAPNATVMSWRGTKGGIEAAKAKHDVIMTPTAYAYLNFGQGDPAYEPLTFPDYIPLKRVYGFDPVPKELSAEEAKYVIGGQGNLWTEYIKTPETAEYQLFPRMLALSEVLWTDPKNKDYSDFLRRLPGELKRLDKQNVNYRIPEPQGLANTIVGPDETATLSLQPASGTRISYTLDGSTPNETSTLYEKPVEVSIGKNETVEVKTIVVLPNGRKSSVYAATYMRREMLEPVELKEKRDGVTFAFSAPASDASTLPIVVSGETRSIGLGQFARTADLKLPFAVSFDGYIKASSDGIYEFQTDSIWNTSIRIGGNILVESIGSKDRAVKSALVPLKAGWHRISIRYDHRGGETAFRVRWGIKGEGLRSIESTDLAH